MPAVATRRWTVTLDRTEAREVGHLRLSKLRELPYAELRDMDRAREVRTSGSGATYQVVSESWWDGGRRAEGGNLRVVVYVDDGGLSAYAPLTIAFIVRPDGTYVDGDCPEF